MIHVNTTNKSFLKVYHLLKEKGIENCTFFLKLKDPSLEFINPFDEENLTDDIKKRIIIECTTNPWYFIRECVLIPASGVVRYELNLGNLAFTWAALNNLSVYMILPRQCGKTFAAAVIILWITYFGGLNTESMLYAQTDHNIDNNQGRIRTLRENLPKFLNFHNQRKDRDGAKYIQFSALGNRILRQAPKKSELAADSVGRGFSTPVCWYDEFAFIPHIKTQFQASALAQSTVAKTAQGNGLPNSIMITTTAAFLNNADGKYANKFFNDCLEFDESMYSLSRDEILELMENHSKRKFLSIFYPYWELGKDDDYFQEQATLLGWDKDDIDREILCKWKEVGTDHPLGQEAVSLLENNIHKPKRIVVVNNIYRVKFYRDPSTIDWSIPYIIGGDCANNIGADYSALVIIDPRDYEVVATVRTNMYSTMFFARLIISLMRNYFYNSILVLERNLNGATILDRVLEEDIGLRDRIYAQERKSDKKPEVLGVTTVSKSRTLLYNQVLKTAVDNSYNIIHDKVIIEEIQGLIKTRTGRIDHRQGGHDDTLISYLFARWFLMFGEKIERYINPLIVGMFSDVNGDNEMANEKAKEEIQKNFMEKEKRENNIIHNMFNKGTVHSNLGNQVLSLREQHEAIINDTYRGYTERAETPDSIFKAASNYDRFNPENKDIKDKVLYELEKEEEEDMKSEDEEKENMNLYFKNPKDIAFKKRAVHNPNQLEREILSSNDISDLSSFISQFKKRY
jgi:hypothetical protein